MSSAIELENVCAAYGSPEPEARQVLHDVSLSVEEGRLCALLGPNGSGKSTLVRVIAGLLAPTQGTVWWRGLTFDARSREEHARLVALVPQRTEIAFGFTVREVVAMGRAPHQGALMRERREDRDAVDQALADCALESLQHRAIASLSGGEQQRVHVARALAQQPAILLLDEATAHLDVRHAAQLFELLGAQIRERRLTCVAAMHDFNAALHYADDAIVMHAGAVAGAGGAAAVLEPELLSRVFGVDIVRGTLPGGAAVIAVSLK